jgi:hypothetical protein
MAHKARAFVSRVKALTAIAIAIVVTNQPLCAGASAPASPSEWSVLSSFQPQMLARWARAAQPNAEGAVNVNRFAYQSVALQRETVDQIPQGVLTKNPALITSALAIMSYALAHVNGDGSFQFRQDAASRRAGFPADTAAASSAAFFMYDLGHSMLLLDESPWFTSSSQTAGLRSRLSNEIKPKAAKALAWLTSQADALEWDNRAVNRLLTYGAAYYLCGQALNDSRAVSLGRHFIQEALARQTSDGVLPEAEGFDSSYQAVSLYLLAILYLHIDPADRTLRSSVWTALSQGVSRELAAIDSNGNVDVSQNTRVKQVDHVDHRLLMLSLEYYGILSGNAQIQRTAQRIFHRFG